MLAGAVIGAVVITTTVVIVALLVLIVLIMLFGRSNGPYGRGRGHTRL